ncbi:MAG: TraR/DksA C4-type zinc finger protein [Actinobacteria bacterium]|nr:TraR/DksA C4-type zinc finger protein [Actinomycetota bacterium]MCG2798354.1 TraR/DksA C4-type zinc finger protein [Cellulomonas sp.]
MPLDPAAALTARAHEVTARLAALDADLAVVRDARGPEQSDDEHDPEGATLADDLARLVGLRRAAASELAAVEAAQARLSTGTYGVCERCDGPIGAGRLAVRPAAVRCVACADLG